MRSHTYTDDLERQGDLQPGMSRHHREWNAENGVREPAADLSRMAEDVRNIEAVQVIKVLHDALEAERRRDER